MSVWCTYCFPELRKTTDKNWGPSPTTMRHNGLPFLLPAGTESAKQDNIWLTLHRVDICAFSKNHPDAWQKRLRYIWKKVRNNMRILQCPEPSRNLLDNPITSFCIFPSLSFGWLYWTTHILLFPVNINHPSSCFLDAVHSVAQYLFCYLLADFKPSHFFDILYTLTCSDSREVSKPFRLKNHTKLYCEDDNNEKY